MFILTNTHLLFLNKSKHSLGGISSIHISIHNCHNSKLQDRNAIFLRNKYDQLKKRIDYDLAVLGIGAAKHSFNNTDGIKLDYVDPANLIYSYTEDPNFDDVYYFGEVKQIKSNEIKKQFPEFYNEKFEQILKKSSNLDVPILKLSKLK